jgi:hypothetical protein
MPVPSVNKSAHSKPRNTFEELARIIAPSLEAYPQLRPHLSLGMKTHEQMHNEKAGSDIKRSTYFGK